ncbi:MAG: phosphatidylglycerophosphatase A [Phycisphaerales bacterium]|nr:phosphatidylglycerophosphatase A [Phycisphaerales bacterium]MCB9862438.1 phosphatidylglycerophosphatase A [Phycisphaerales bacterium]
MSETTTDDGPNRADVSRTRSSYDRLLLFIGSMAFIGFVPFASGTVTVAVLGLPLAILLLVVLKLGVTAYVAFVAIFTLFSIWVAGEADRVLNEKDSKRNVIDELPGYLIALVALPMTWPILFAAFFIERAIDIAKVWPANWIERKLPGGWGVVLDDVMAGIYTLAILHVAYRLLPDWLGAYPIAF